MPIRETFWNIPHWAEIAQYILAAATIIVFLYGVGRRILRWRKGRPEKRTGHFWARLGSVLSQVLAQRRTLAEAYPGIMHFTIFWGMLVLAVGTALATVDWDITHLFFGFQILTGWVYILFELMLDILGLLVIVGLGMAIFATLSISPQLTDIWGGPMSQEFTHTFTTKPYAPNISLTTQTSTIYLTPQDPSLVVQAVNISNVPLSVGRLPLDFFMKLQGPNGYEMQGDLQNFESNSWVQPLSVPSDRMQDTELFLRPDQSALEPGIYFFRFDFGQGSEVTPEIYPGPYLLVVSNLPVTFKVSATEALAWVVDLRNYAPLPNAPVTIYNESGAPIAEAQTDAQGVFKAAYEPLKNPYETI